MIGVDLYPRYNIVTDWVALARIIDFAWVKLTDGTAQPLVHADAYVAGCAAHGIPWGGYHFAEAGDPVVQADAFVAQLRRLVGWRLAPALDIESGDIPSSQRAAFARTFIERVRAAFDCRITLYSSTSWLTNYLNPDSWPYNWDITWAAEYGANDGYNHPIVHYSGRVDCHQYTSQGYVAGIAGACDLDYTADLSLITAKGDDMEPTDTVKDPGPGHWGWIWLNAQQITNHIDAKVDALAAALKSLGADLDLFEAAEANRDMALTAQVTKAEGEILTAVAAIQAGDPQAFANALAPLLPPSVTPTQLAAAFAAVAKELGA